MSVSVGDGAESSGSVAGVGDTSVAGSRISPESAPSNIRQCEQNGCHLPATRRCLKTLVYRCEFHSGLRLALDDRAALSDALIKYASAIEADRHEPDKIMCHTVSMRMAALSAATMSDQHKHCDPVEVTIEKGKGDTMLPTPNDKPQCSRLDCSQDRTGDYLCAEHLAEEKKQGQKFSAWDNGYAFGMERGATFERNSIVKWLRGTGDWFSNIPDNGQCEHGEWSWEGCETCCVNGIASAIENGEHNEQ